MATRESQRVSSFHIDFRFILIWVLVNYAGGYAVLLILQMVYLVFKPNAAPIDALKNPIFFITLRVALGLLQWLVFRNRMSRSAGWITLTAIGAIAGLGFMFCPYAAGIKLGDWMYGVIGLFIGFAQYQLLGRRFNHASVWILVSALEGYLFQLIGTFGKVSQEIGRMDILAVLIFSKVLFLALMGLTFLWIIQYPLPDRKTA